MELEQGAQILKNVKYPMHMMVGEHDWYFDLGEKWRDLFGEPTYSFDHKGVHFVVLNSVVEKDFWTARGMTPMERMQTVAGLDNRLQSRFEVGRRAARLAAEGSRAPGRRAAGDRLLALAALQVLPPVELLDGRRGAGAVDPRTLPQGRRHSRAHPPAAHQPHRQHPVPRHALHRLALALRPRGAAGS